ncbi:MAG: nucleoside phosphorylase [Pseudomonadales bacterium]|nr:nucleoside phosphorylase [Pseudomonadales bacterium]MBO6564874.1 nucleoside phosphorylase [Pseudomonadales bacterium]MBO6596800.1 nucleoside phosphorylase [Pseudomonadales bacterium]MBO6658519.1 nucleoside phosphorylase [Pseudomonadales bacterium]MBO6703470.1 nucleoside phosphorylase [Pseudomonadales bacterium]
MAFLPILKTDSDNIPDRVLVVGDPNRLDVVAESLSDVKEVAHNREYRTLRGTYHGQEIGAISHGVGSAGAGACFEEICQSGARRIIRSGSAGGMQDDVTAGDVVIATGAVREDGLSPKLVPLGYPAIATPDLIIAMHNAAASLGIEAHEGLLLTSDMFYPHEVLGSDLPLWQRAGVTAVEMEVATLFVICSLHGVETAAVVAIDGNPLAQDDGSMETYDPHQDSVKKAVADSLQIALTALVS